MERYIRVFLLGIFMMLGLVNNAFAGYTGPDLKMPMPGGYSWGVNTIPGSYYTHRGVYYYSIDFDDNIEGDTNSAGQQIGDLGEGIVDVLAAASGEASIHPSYGGYGNTVIIDHGNGYKTIYGHLDSFAISGGEVNQGEVLGKLGTTGNSDGPHVHFQIMHDNDSSSDNEALRGVTVEGIRFVDYHITDEVNGPYYPSTNYDIPTDAYSAITAKADELWALGLIEYEPTGGNMHWYGGDDATDTTFIIEDWDGGTWGTGDDWVAITFDPANVDQTEAYVLRHGFFQLYRDNGGPDMFGAPIGDEMDTTRQEYTPHDSWWGTSKTNAIINNCGPTSQFTSVQRFEHSTFCWYEPEWRACLADLGDTGDDYLPYCYELTDDALHQPAVTSPSPGTSSSSSTSTSDPATWWYSSLDMTSQGPVDGIDSAADIRGYVNSSTGQYRVTFTGGNGNIYTETSDGDGQGGTWGAMTLSAFAWVPYVRDGITTYPFYDSTTGDEAALFVGEDGNMWFMTIDGTTGSITATSTNGYAGLPYANGNTDPTGYYDPFTGDLQLYFVGTDNHLRQLLRDGVTGSWSSYDFTSVFSGWTLYPGTHPTAFMDPVNGIHYVLFTETDRRVKLLMSSDTVTWTGIDLTSLAPVDYTVSTPTGFVHPITGAFYVYLMGQNQRVYEIWYDGAWYGNDLTAQAPVPYGEYGTSVSAVVNTLTGDILVTFQGDNHRINQFRYRNQIWTATDLTSRISVEYARAGSTPYTFVDPFTGAETTLFAGSNHRIQLIRFGPAFGTTPVTTPTTTGPTHTDQYLFIDVDNNGVDDPCIRQGTELYCDRDLNGQHDWTFSIGSGNAEYFSNGTGATVVWPGGDTWYHDTNSDSVTNSTCSYGDGFSETQRLVWRNTIMVRWGNAIYLDRNLDGITDNQVNWGAGTATYHLADMNGDGNVDVLRQSGNRFYVDTNNDGFPNWSFTYGATNGSDDYYFADIDGDGADDILVRRCLTACNWFLVLYNSSISHSCPNCSHGNDDDFTYGHGL